MAIENRKSKIENPRMLARLGLVVVCLAFVWLGAVVRRPFLLADDMAAGNVKLERRALELKNEIQTQRKQAAALQKATRSVVFGSEFRL